MNKQRVIELLTHSKPGLQAHFGVASLAPFGSTACDEATNVSDLDILVA